MAGTLSQYAVGRDNNFNLIRFVAALGVLFGHAYPIVGVHRGAMARDLALAFSTGGVDVFFVISGYLVTASLFARHGLGDFVRARVLRIYPVLLVTSVLGAFVIGPFVTRLAAGAYLGSGETWRYAWQNAFLIWPMGVRFELPGVFQHTPIARVVNGSLWTLPWELSMYVMLALAGVVAYYSRMPGARTAVRRGLVVLAVLSSAGLALNEAAHLSSAWRVVQGLRFVSLFTAGAAFQVLRERIRVGTPGAIVAAIVVALVQLARGRLDLLYAPAATYAVLWLAYVPRGFVRRYNRLGDYSYGLYAYAFPIEQCVVDRVPGATFVRLVATAGTITLACAVLSWHVLEKPMMALKSRAWTRRGAARAPAA